MTKGYTLKEIAQLEHVRTGNPSSLSMEELAARQIGRNSRNKPVVGGVAYARKFHTEQKNIARGIVVSLMKPVRWGRRSLSILTMPGIDWTFERRLLSVREGNWQNRTQPARSTHITSVEIDPGIYAAAITNIPRTAKAPIVLHRASPLWCAHAVGSDAIRRFYQCDVYNMMEQGTNDFDAAWLDFQGPLTAKRMEVISGFFTNHVRELLVVTLLAARHSGETLQEIDECGGDIEGWLRDTLCGEVLHVYRYKDGASPMIQYAVRK